MPRRLSGAGPRHQMPPAACLVRAVAFLLLVQVPGAQSLGLYSPGDLLVQLETRTLERRIFNSTGAWVVEFYASWCGHCKAFAPIWKGLANDTKDWRPAVMLGAIDCADFSNKNVCYKFGIKSYPTVKFFKKFSQKPEDGIKFNNNEKTIESLRGTIITLMESHEDTWPSASPSLRPTSVTELRDFFLVNNVTYLALIFDEDNSFLSREVALDMFQYENIAVRRVLQSNEELVKQFNITTFPSGLLVTNNGSCRSIPGHADWRSQYTNFLRNLSGVFRRDIFIPTVSPTAQSTMAFTVWKVADQKKIYMADVESAVLYTLRREAAVFSNLEGEQLSTLKDFLSVLVQHFAGRLVVKNYLYNLDLWLRPKTNISRSEWEDALRNKKEFPNATLPEKTHWIGCQGSKSTPRGFSCGLWTLFHHLTVQAACQKQPTSLGTPEVLPTMRRYIRNFFACRDCAEHFEAMAAESMHEVKNRDQAVLWLWSRHNRVNARLAVTETEDPKFPKIQWPPKSLCPSCHYTSTDGGKSMWDENRVLMFLKWHFSEKNIYMDSPLEHHRRNGRNVAQQNHEGERKLEGGGRGEEDDQGNQKEPDEEKKAEQLAAGKVEKKKYGLGKPGSPEWHKPSIVKMSTKAKEMVEDIVDLDTFSEQHFKSKALKMARQISDRERRTKRDTRLFLMENEGHRSLDYIRESLRHKNLGAKQFSGIQVEKENTLRGKQWIYILGMGFSRLDVSLCVVLYLLSSVCLLGMYTFFRMRMGYRKARLGYSLT
ncbi:sulfhydryl oxidase 1 [Protobothrops mucrosquamatus]|uniref:sulfhydryl oxidase 1 n=1 Tax=Protobothrops mucrosquamatus TaxID=103944 RepID=UPI000775962A|nr:sulfhydryl oxidase 1 [Protobothrops mucrosquamatus]